jgi:hypothetical protein
MQAFEEKIRMKISKNSLILTAAFTGLLGGTAARAAAPAFQDTSKQDATKSTAKVAKHSCAGKNSCAGQGGCATDGSKKNKAAAANVTAKHSCAGKNSCSGQGGCATDGSAKKK